MPEFKGNVAVVETADFYPRDIVPAPKYDGQLFLAFSQWHTASLAKSWWSTAPSPVCPSAAEPSTARILTKQTVAARSKRWNLPSPKCALAPRGSRRDMQNALTTVL